MAKQRNWIDEGEVMLGVEFVLVLVCFVYKLIIYDCNIHIYL